MFIFFLLTAFSFASPRINEASLQEEFGKDLTKAPFFLRFSFSKHYNKDWKVSYYYERKDFLTDYEKNLALEQARDRAEEKAEAADERQRSIEKRQADRLEENRLKARLAEQNAEQDIVNSLTPMGAGTSPVPQG